MNSTNSASSDLRRATVILSGAMLLTLWLVADRCGSVAQNSGGSASMGSNTQMFSTAGRIPGMSTVPMRPDSQQRTGINLTGQGVTPAATNPSVPTMLRGRVEQGAVIPPAATPLPGTATMFGTTFGGTSSGTALSTPARPPFAPFVPTQPADSPNMASQDSALLAMRITSLRRLDDDLRQQMRAVSSWLEQYTVWNNRFPEFGDSMNWAQGQLGQLVANNPYTLSSTEVPAPSASFISTSSSPTTGAILGDRVRLNVDSSLNGNIVEQASEATPEQWVAPPGTITAISNNIDLFLVWGAGADGRPIRDPLTGKPILLMGRWGVPR